MKLDRRTPDVLAHVGVQETKFCGISKLGGFECNSNSDLQSFSRWKASINLRAKLHPPRWDFTTRISNGFTEVAQFGNVVSFEPQARIQAEIRAVLAVLEWLRHEDHRVHCTITVSPRVYVFLTGGKRDLPKLKELLSRFYREYLEAGEMVCIEQTGRVTALHERLRAA